MTYVRSFKELIGRLAEHRRAKRVAVVYGTDPHTEYALTKAIEAGFITVIMIGPKSKVESYSVFKKHPQSVRFIDTLDLDEAARIAVRLVRTNEADILMKGNINTDNLLRAILDAEKGILPSDTVLSHLSIAEMPNYSKLLFFMDAAVIPYPSIQQRRAMLRYMVHACHRFGIENPQIALIHFTEKINPKFSNSIDYNKLVKEANDGGFGRAVLDGPLDISTACNPDCGVVKGINTSLVYKADALMFPNLDASNVFYKTLVLFGQSEMAGVLMGPKCPVVVTSRGDSGKTKLNSIAMACLITDRE